MSGAGLPPSADTLPYPGAGDFEVGVVSGMGPWAATLRTCLKCLYEACNSMDTLCLCAGAQYDEARFL